MLLKNTILTSVNVLSPYWHISIANIHKNQMTKSVTLYNLFLLN